ncbi:uncharacterized serine-rich protein C215.13 [Tetranychus urticae]|nr:uncharacterized serine-rich protein C215.13 [Tetranychus urticae]XP_015787050.1 uncharacterized serine-rich protein C215.13 [Tetranychus urticae]XP_025016937.1 uncharacterized serine-rich protein C215.13 [Tetranychus urticae]XP_025016938.1 uncharacterized serine-rich protein C215.13 [Tetranychus urticae]XP_025016939.1 uncharacterized serine-rich protein C215.13 [Tetranychus urticae]XP_025016940.1 uncharacterized serine-rich protein C215.13 [Tetranychus urticae]XP_025016941.1 uncharacterize
MTEGKNGSSDNPENVKNDLTGCCVKSRLPKDLKIKCGQLFGPFTDPLQWLAIKCTEPSTANINTIDRKSVDLFNKIDIARDSKEQNMEIILVNGQFYFRSTVSIDALSSSSSSSSNNSSKLLAWFDEDLNSRLPMASMATLNGSKRYYCSLCNQVSLYPNPVVIHILFECPKRHEILVPYMKISNIKANDHREIKGEVVSSSSSGPSASFNQPSIANNNQSKTTSTVVTKKRSFDIDSLVNDDKFIEDAGKKSRLYNEMITEFNNAHNFHPAESIPLMNSLSPLSLTSASNRLISPPSPNSQPSAFRKVDKSNRHLTGINLAINHNLLPQHQQTPSSNHQPSPHHLFDFASLTSLYSRGLNCELSSTLFSGHSNFVPTGLPNPLLSPTQPPTPSSSSSSSSGSSSSTAFLSTSSGAHFLASSSIPGPISSSPSSSSPSPSSAGRGEVSTGPISSIPTSSSSSTSSNSTANNNSKSMIPASLLPFLPPSLAALSFPQTNWCAKCNATFRMTSDLVYHMRSHHKKEVSADPLKKKREEKLRCNICGESFRERHHLTRHMTSHQ